MNDSPPSRLSRPIALGVAFITGMAVFGLIIQHAVLSAKRLDEFVTVKGLSEREVPADLAIWPLAFSVGENELALLQREIARGRTAVQEFLAKQGFEPAEISQGPPRINEVTPSNDADKPRFRYRATITVLLRSSKVAKVKAAMEACDQLVEAGLVLQAGDYGSRTQFLFTGLNDIKPAMIQEANRNARKAAEKFADDSQARVGAIKHAVQGPFEINDVDESSPDRKTVRVVTTVDFYLK